MTEFLHLTERDVATLLGPAEVVEALRHMLAVLAVEQATNLPKTFGTWGNGASMHALGSLMPQRGYLGFKTWARTNMGGAAIFSLFDSETGDLLATLEARTLGQLRTSGITGVATDLLSPAGTSRMALIGTGAQAMLQLASVAAVRSLKRVAVFSPTADRRAAFVARARGFFPDLQIDEVASVEEATDGAEIVTLITRAKEPFLRGEHLMRGSHLNAVGAILPASAEFEQAVFDRVDLIAVDDVENARQGSRELRERFGSDARAWSPVRPLASLISMPAPSRPRTTLFKGMGMGLSDLALAIAAYEAARKSRIRFAQIQMPERLDYLAVRHALHVEGSG